MGNVASAFALPFKSPDWFPRLLLIGLITLIPVIGWINVVGWMLATLDNYRHGIVELPPAGFQYIGRGATLFLVGLVYALAIALVFAVPVFILTVGSLSDVRTNSFTPNPSFTGLSPLVGIVEYTFLPSVVIATDRGGFRGGFNIPEIWRMASSSWKNSLIAAILIYVASFLGALGLVACCVGILVSYPYALAVDAGIIRYFEATFEPPQQVPQAF